MPTPHLFVQLFGLVAGVILYVIVRGILTASESELHILAFNRPLRP